jgi:hypothetical protein
VDDPVLSKPTPLDADAYLCEQCGYSLIGSMESRRCPECGLEFNPFVLSLARIPWLHRASLGSFTAYLQTLRAIFFRPEESAGEFRRLVRIGIADAEKFRRVSVRIAIVSGALLFGSFTVFDLRMAAMLLVWSSTVLFVFYFIISRPPTLLWDVWDSDYLEPPALFEYTAAPLALVPVLDTVGMILIVTAPDLGDAFYRLILYALVSSVALAIVFWYVYATLLGKTCQLDLLVITLSLPLHWAFAVLVTVLVGIIMIAVVGLILLLLMPLFTLFR